MSVFTELFAISPTSRGEAIRRSLPAALSSWATALPAVLASSTIGVRSSISSVSAARAPRVVGKVQALIAFPSGPRWVAVVVALWTSSPRHGLGVHPRSSFTFLLSSVQMESGPGSRQPPVRASELSELGWQMDPS
ncbi:MAG: hypothetical protein WCA77_02045 [Thermoplasmata archaeon]